MPWRVCYSCVCFYYPYPIWIIITSHFDYCNSMVTNISASKIRPLQISLHLAYVARLNFFNTFILLLLRSQILQWFHVAHKHVAKHKLLGWPSYSLAWICPPVVGSINTLPQIKEFQYSVSLRIFSYLISQQDCSVISYPFCQDAARVLQWSPTILSLIPSILNYHETYYRTPYLCYIVVYCLVLFHIPL